MRKYPPPFFSGEYLVRRLQRTANNGNGVQEHGTGILTVLYSFLPKKGPLRSPQYEVWTFNKSKFYYYPNIIGNRCIWSTEL